MRNVALLRSAARGSVLCALVLASCGTSGANEDASTPTSLPYVTTSTSTTTLLISEDPHIDLGEEDSVLVSFEAAWVCELQRRTFTDPGAIDAALDDKLIDSGIAPDSYAEFRQRVNERLDLREAILYRYQETCRT